MDVLCAGIELGGSVALLYASRELHMIQLPILTRRLECKLSIDIFIDKFNNNNNIEFEL